MWPQTCAQIASRFEILHENDATEEEMKRLFEEERMRKLLTEVLQKLRAEILVQHGEVSPE